LKLLLDECINWRFARDLADHEVVWVPDAGWRGVKNGELLALAQQEFDAFITVDRNLQFQQNVSRFKIAVLVLKGRSIEIDDLRTLLPQIRSVLPSLVQGTVTVVSSRA
jgi:predicted nuclease of predicted toxin-antitoxin system